MGFRDVQGYILEYKYHIMKIKQRITWPSFIICSRENINHEKDKGRRWEYKDKIHVDNAFVRIKFQVNIHHEKNLYKRMLLKEYQNVIHF